MVVTYGGTSKYSLSHQEINSLVQGIRITEKRVKKVNLGLYIPLQEI